jgi:hypothetical protein
MYDAEVFEEVDDDVVKRLEANREAIKQIFKILGENACGDIWNNEEEYNEWGKISEV